MNKVLLIFKIRMKKKKIMSKSSLLFQSMPECDNMNRDGEDIDN